MGFPTVTLGVLLGFGVRYAGGVPVDAAQIVGGMLTWLVLGWAVGVRVVRHWAGRRAAFAGIPGFGAGGPGDPAPQPAPPRAGRGFLVGPSDSALRPWVAH